MQNQFINFVKGISCLLVFLLHFTFIYSSSHPDYNISYILYTPAWTAVWIFFILSGYLIGKGFWKGKYNSDSWNNVKLFYKQRAKKILPLYFIIVIIDMCFINSNMYINGSETLSRILTFRLRNPYGNNMIGNLWFISTIVQMYLVTPFVWKYIVKPIQNCKYKNHLNVLLMCLMIFGYYNFRVSRYAFDGTWDYFILPHILANLDLFFVPFIFAKYTVDLKDTILKKILRPLSLIIFFIFLVRNTYLMYCCYHVSYYYFPIVQVKFTTITVLVMLLCLYAYDIENEYKNLLKNTWKENLIAIVKNPTIIFSYLGIISFEFYSSHCQIINNLKNLSLVRCLLFALLFNLIWSILLHKIIRKINN